MKKNKKNSKNLLPPLTPEECSVEFDDNTQGKYLAGDSMSGKIILFFEKSKSLNGIKLDIFGKARCGWKQKFGRNIPIFELEKKQQKNVKSAHQDLFHWSTFLMQAGNGPKIKLVARTAMTYNFAFRLLKDIPASFEGKFGYVRYFIKITVIQSDEIQQSRLVRLQVQPILDLNKEHKLLKTPTSKESYETMCYVPPDNLGLIVKLPRSAYVFGEIIPITVHCKNGTSLKCKCINISLELCAKYATNNRDFLNEKITITKLSCGPVFEKEKKDFIEAIRVPDTPITSINTCGIVQLSYWIRVKTSMQYYLRNATVKIPITIGNVPYNDETVSASSHSAETVVRPQTPNLQGEVSSTVSSSNFREERAPPSYEESLSMSTSLEPTTSRSNEFSDILPFGSQMTQNRSNEFSDMLPFGSQMAPNRSNEFSETLSFGPQMPVFAAQNQLLPSAPNLPIKYKKRYRRRRTHQNPDETASSDIAV